MTLLSSLILVAEPLLLGLVNYMAPDQFLAPNGGLVPPSMTNICETSLEGNRIEPHQACSDDGVWCLHARHGYDAGSSQGHHGQADLLRTKLYNATLMLLVWLHMALTMDDSKSMLNPKIVGVYVGLNVAAQRHVVDVGFDSLLSPLA